MNPGKLVDARRADENLRQRPAAPVATTFAYAADGGDFSRALQRCVGVGECRREKGGVMCPSYMVTREEKHSTRGRARLLDEMLRGEVLTGGWREESVRDALDLCLSCKGCKSDCPVGVDVATWKAEFLSRYYAGRLRPAAAYSMGLLHRWARIAGAAPGIANFVTQTPGLASVARAVAGISQRRTLPRFAPETFRAWFARRKTPAATASQRPSLSRHVHEPLLDERRPRRRRSARSRGVRRLAAARAPLLRPAALRLRDARHREEAPREDCRSARAARRGGAAGRRSRAVLRRRFQGRAAGALSAGRARRAAVARDGPARGAPRPGRTRLPSHPLPRDPPSSSSTATSAPSSASTPTAGRSLASASTSRSRIRAAAAWRELSASRSPTTTFRSRSASASSCPRCGRPRPTR